MIRKSRSALRLWGLILLGGLISNKKLNAQQISGIPENEQENIRVKAVHCLHDVEALMQYFAQKGTSSEDVQEGIAAIQQQDIFYDSLVTIEDDLYALRADSLFPKDVSIANYFNDLHLFYNKSSDGKSILFSEFRLSPIQRKDYDFIKVYFECRYRERHKDFDADYPIRKRIALFRIEKKDETWQVKIAGIRFYNPSGADGKLTSPEEFEGEFKPFVRQRKNKLPAFTTTTDSVELSQLEIKLQRENDSLYAASLKNRLIQSEAEKKKEELYLEAVSRGDSLFKARNFADAIDAFSEARSQKPFEIYPRDKIRELTRLLADPKSDPAEILKSQLQEAKRLLKFRDYEAAMEVFQLALKLSPDDSVIKSSIRNLDEILRKSEERRAICMAGKAKVALKAFAAEADENRDNPDFFFQRARCFLQAGERKKALLDLSKAITMDGNYREAYLTRCGLYLKEGQLPAAVADLTALTSIDAQNPEHHFQKGEVLISIGDVAAAGKAFEQALVLQPDNARYLTAKAGVFRRTGRADDALQLAEKAISIRPDFPLAHFEKGLALLEKEDDKNAGSAIQRARRLGLGQTLVQQLEAMASEAEKAAEDEIKNEAPEKAIQFLKRTLILKPGYAQAHLRMAEIYVAQNKLPEALKAADQAAFVKEDFSAAYLFKGNLLLQSGEFNLALNPLYRAKRYDRKNPQIGLSLGSAFMQLQQYDSAMAWFGDAVKLKPDLAEAYLQRGICHYRKENYVRATQEFEHALRYNSRFGDAHFYIGMVNKAYNRFDKAIENFQDAEMQGYKKYDCNVEIGLSYEKLGKRSKGRQYYTQAIKLEPDLAKAYLLRGMNNLNDGNRQDAMADLDEGLKIDTSSKNVEPRTELGFLYLEFDNWPKAEALFKKTLASDRLNPKANFGLGICLFNRFESEAAMGYIEQALVAGKLNFAEIKELPGTKKLLKDKKFKALKDRFLR